MPQFYSAMSSVNSEQSSRQPLVDTLLYTRRACGAVKNTLDKNTNQIYNKNRKRQDLKRLCQKFELLKNNANFWKGWRYFFMVNAKSNKVIIKQIM